MSCCFFLIFIWKLSSSCTVFYIIFWTSHLKGIHNNVCMSALHHSHVTSKPSRSNCQSPSLPHAAGDFPLRLTLAKVLCATLTGWRASLAVGDSEVQWEELYWASVLRITSMLAGNLSGSPPHPTSLLLSHGHNVSCSKFMLLWKSQQEIPKSKHQKVPVERRGNSKCKCSFAATWSQCSL